MSATILKLIPDDEVRILQAYLRGLEDPALEDLYDQIGIPQDGLEPTRIEVAVAQILLNAIQEDLPNCYCFTTESGGALSREPHNRLPEAKLSFSPQLICTINWADGFMFSWPESYYITYLPSFNKFIVTASTDGIDAYGCSDFAIGFAAGDLNPIEVARKVITDSWLSKARGWDQARWAYLFDEGLIDNETAQAWADEVWPIEGDEDEK